MQFLSITYVAVMKDRHCVADTAVLNTLWFAALCINALDSG